jgi:hypothetical protein
MPVDTSEIIDAAGDVANLVSAIKAAFDDGKIEVDEILGLAEDLISFARERYADLKD